MAHGEPVPPFPRKVYEYLDYRLYLRDFYAYQKQHVYGFSYRVLSRRAGCRSTQANE